MSAHLETQSVHRAEKAGERDYERTSLRTSQSPRSPSAQLEWGRECGPRCVIIHSLRPHGERERESTSCCGINEPPGKTMHAREREKETSHVYVGSCMVG